MSDAGGKSMNSRSSTSKEIEKYKDSVRVREKLPPVEMVTVDGDHVLVDAEPKPVRIANPTCDTLRRCSAHKIPMNECVECWTGYLGYLGMSAGNYHHIASGAAKRAEGELSLQERTMVRQCLMDQAKGMAAEELAREQEGVIT